MFLLEHFLAVLLLLPTTINASERAISNRGFIDFLFSPCKCKCGLPNREGKFSGGEFLKSYEFPWLSSVQINGNKQISSIPATLINNKYVITSASRLIGLTSFDVKVTLGQYDRCFPDVSSTNVSVERIILHPDYSPGSGAHDLALLKLSTPVIFERRINPICLSIPGNKYLGQVATLAGFHAAEENQEDGGDQAEAARSTSTSCRPRKVGLPILDAKDCPVTALDSKFVTNDKGCVGVVGAPSIVCETDAGGPIMFRSHSGVYELIGVLTDKNECSAKPSTALYTTINDHLSWITYNTKDACYCFKT